MSLWWPGPIHNTSSKRLPIRKHPPPPWCPCIGSSLSERWAHSNHTRLNPNSLRVSLSIRPLVRPCAGLSVCWSIRLSTHRSICLSTHRSIRLSTHRSIRLSVRLSTTCVFWIGKMTNFYLWLISRFWFLFWKYNFSPFCSENILKKPLHYWN